MGYYRNDREFNRGRRDYEPRDPQGRDQGSYDDGDRYADSGWRDRHSASYGGGYGPRYGAARDDGQRYDSDRSRFGPRAQDHHERDRHQRPPSSLNYDRDDRGFFDRAGDEVRSWFGDEEAERRRELDARYEDVYTPNRYGQTRHDPDYHNWRNQQIAALDRDYDEYRRENQSRFSNEFGSWRQQRTTQRGSLDRVNEHMEVIGRDGEHVGTVDKVRGDRIVLTKTDADAGGHHHSIPSNWIQSVDDKVTISKTAAEAQNQWRDEERRGALFGDDPQRTSSQSRYAPGFTRHY